MQNQKLLVVIVGPTAVGKTSIGIELAKYFNSEILSADSRQFYKEISIGTAKPSNHQMGNIPHHFVNALSIKQSYDVRKFEKDAEKILNEIFKKYNLAFAVGGSGLYVKALCEGLDDMPPADMKIRAELESRIKLEGLTALAGELQSIDPEFTQNADLSNPRKVIRALEVYYITGKLFSTFRKKGINHNLSQGRKHKFPVLKIGLSMDREELYRRIDRRVDEMISEGLLDEVKQLWPYRHYQALQTVGYQELIGYLNREYDWQEAVRLVKRNSRRLAKRQLTWFRKDPEINWFSMEEEKTLGDTSIIEDKTRAWVEKKIIKLIDSKL